MQTFYPPSSREVANLTERKNPHAHAPVYGVKEFVRLSVCLLQTLTPIISGVTEQNQEWAKKEICHTNFTST